MKYLKTLLLAVCLLLMVPVYYRFRMVMYSLADDPRLGALGNCRCQCAAVLGIQCANAGNARENTEDPTHDHVHPSNASLCSN